MAKERRGVCPECQEERSVTAAGKVRQHYPRVKPYGFRSNTECPGTGQPPASFVENPIAVAEARGYARAIADLRAEGTRALKRAELAGTTHPGWDMYDSAADYLDTVRRERDA